jgi:predicted TIM-barrel fold metal-dependent hydrolase
MGQETAGEITFDYVVSGDSHLVEPYELWESALGAKWGDKVPRLVEQDGADGRLWFTGAPGEYFWVGEGMLDGSIDDDEMRDLQTRAGYDPDARLRCQDIDGIAAEVLTATWMLYGMRIADPELRRDCCRVYNDWAAEFVAGNTDRFVALAMIPTDDVRWACAEYERTAAMGLKGGVVFADTPDGDLPYRDRYYDPLWATASAIDTPIMLHIITGRERDPFTYQGEDLTKSAGAMVAVMQEVQPVLANEFIFGGIFERFPDLKVITGEYEIGWLPYFAWRVDQFERDFAPLWNLPKLAKPAARSVLEQVYYGVVDDPMISTVLQWFDGDVKMVWGSDFPHPRNTFPNTHEVLATMLAELPHEQRLAIVGRNVAELFKLDVPSNAVAGIGRGR